MTRRRRKSRRAPPGFEILPSVEAMRCLLEAVTGKKWKAKLFNAESKRLMGKP